MKRLTGRQTARVMREIGVRFSRETTLGWTRAEYLVQLDKIAFELYGDRS